MTLAAVTSSLAVSGDFIIHFSNTNNVTNALNVNAGRPTIGGSVTINGGNGNRRGERITTGTASVAGNINVNNTNARVTFAGAGTLNIGGDFANGGTFTASTGTVSYNGAANQNVDNYAYRDLRIHKSGRDGKPNWKLYRVQPAHVVARHY